MKYGDATDGVAGHSEAWQPPPSLLHAIRKEHVRDYYFYTL